VKFAVAVETPVSEAVEAVEAEGVGVRKGR